ncbi:Mbov_0400 family ICE element protein [Mycoplasma zalophidermidis]|uniref:Mbov_0400 family ICE element protein n=1 Tax=Mycoplasma zalophidermidis TaxID=398174 RepID=UPI00215D173F|nr:hypothetical protein [Mycoplasma zalophidermidis]MCR8966450.1 hypothetical protein [Mycoplasma zalophidermidis]
MEINKWTPLKIKSPQLENIFNLNLDYFKKNGTPKAHPIVILKSKDKYYCIRLQTKTPTTEKSNILIDNSSYQSESYWNKILEVAVTKDVFIIDKDVLEKNIDHKMYKKTNSLNTSDQSLIMNDLNKRINSIPPELNIIEIDKNLRKNLPIYTTPNLIQNQLESTLSKNNLNITTPQRYYYENYFDANQKLKDINTSNPERTIEALREIKKLTLAPGEINDFKDIDFELNTTTNLYERVDISMKETFRSSWPPDIEDNKKAQFPNNPKPETSPPAETFTLKLKM